MMKIREYIPILILSFAFVFGFVFTGFLFKDELKGMVLSGVIKYGTAKGEITKSDTKLDTGRYTSKLIVDIKYDYEVDSIPYVSSVINFAADYHNIDYYLAKYPLGKKVRVYYEVGNPSFAVLEPDKKDWSLVLLPFIWIVLGGIFFLFIYLSTKILWLKQLMELFSRSTR